MVGLGDSRTPVVVAVITDQVGNGRARHRRREDAGVCSQETGVETAPGMADYADLVHDAFLLNLLYRRRDAIRHRKSRLALLENNVRLQHEISVASHGANAVITALGWRVIAM